MLAIFTVYLAQLTFKEIIRDCRWSPLTLRACDPSSHCYAIVWNINCWLSTVYTAKLSRIGSLIFFNYPQVLKILPKIIQFHNFSKQRANFPANFITKSHIFLLLRFSIYNPHLSKLTIGLLIVTEKWWKLLKTDF